MLSLVTWNVDGLCNQHIPLRSAEIAHLILQDLPHVILLQECVPSNQQIFNQRFLSSGYKCIQNDVLPGYYTLGYCKSPWEVIHSQRTMYTGNAHSLMGRDILQFEISNGHQNVLCLCSHLESCREFSSSRMSQLEQLFHILYQYPGPVIIGGDLNIRDNEVKTVFANMRTNYVDFDFKDAWIDSGQLKTEQYTWVSPSNSKIKCRFDRIFFSPKEIQVSSFKLLGTTKLTSTGSTPSDHFGISTSFVLPIPKTTVPNLPERTNDPVDVKGEEVSVGVKRKADRRRLILRALEKRSTGVRTKTSEVGNGEQLSARGAVEVIDLTSD